MKIRDRMQAPDWELVDIEKRTGAFADIKAMFLLDAPWEIIVLCKDVPNGGIEDGDVIIRRNPMNTSEDRLVVVDHGFTRGVGEMSGHLRDIAPDYYLIRWKKENTAELPQQAVHSSVTLTGLQFQQLQQALLSAYPTHASLAQMVRFGLNENLDAIAGTGKLADVSFQLLTWAESQGRLQELVAKAQEANSGNKALRAFIKGFSGQANNQTMPSVPTNNTHTSSQPVTVVSKYSEEILVKLHSHSRGVTYEIQVPLNARVGDLIGEIVKELDFPTTFSDGMSVPYYLILAGETNAQRLDSDLSLRQNGIKEGANLFLTVEMMAG